MHKLSQRDVMACVDDVGRIRCPTCGRFATLANMRPGDVVRGAGIVAHFNPSCVHCAPPTGLPPEGFVNDGSDIEITPTWTLL